MSRIFLDTNVLLYTLAGEARSRQASRALLESYAISVQVLNDFASVVRRRKLLSHDELLEVESGFRQLLHVVPLTVPLHDAGLALSVRYGFSIYDALIVAAAIEAECDVLYTEDLQHGQRIEHGQNMGGRLRVVNPFR